MRYVVDTNVWVYAAAGITKAVGALDMAAEAEWAGYTAITRLELFGYPGLRSGEEELLRSMLACFDEVDVSGGIVDKAIEIRRKRRMKAPDAIIAATAVVMKATLVTRNVQDFRGIYDIEILNPFGR